MIEVERVDFVSVPTRDLTRARRFYGDVLGLARGRSNPEPGEPINMTATQFERLSKAFFEDLDAKFVK